MEKDGAKDRSLREESFIMDINMIEAPLCQYKNKHTKLTAKMLELDSSISDEMRYVISTMPEESKNSQVEFLSWTDSSGSEREILAASVFNLPNAFALDVFHALVGLYIKKNSPIPYIEDKKIYNMPENRLEFRIHELCEMMKITTAGSIYRKIKTAIRELASVKYYSLGSGIFYNKKKEKYESSREKSISLISDYDFFQKSKDSSDSSCEVVFGNLVMENLKYNYIKFLNNNIYFQLPSGLTRRFYSYLEGNRYKKQYIKRSFDVLRYKIPLNFKYASELKRRMKIPLQNLISFGLIKDYFFGDEILIGGTKEQCVYFIFDGTKIDLIKKLDEEYNKKHLKSKNNKKEAIEDKFELQFPKDIQKELEGFGVNDVKIQELTRKHSKYKLAEYILWLKDGISKGKVKDAAGLLIFAITDEKVKVASSHPQISEFIEKIKNEADGKSAVSKELIDKAYKKYIEKEFNLFEKEDEFMFTSMKSTVLDDIEKVKDKKVKSLKQLYNMTTTLDEKDKLLKVIEKWEKFSIEREKSEIFIEMFVKSVKLYRGLKDYEEFKRDYKEKNR